MTLINKLILGVLIFGSTNLLAQTFNTGVDLAIPDNAGEVCSSINVTGVGIINGTYGLQSVTIKINHTYDGDLDIFLQAPDGTRVELSTDNGGGGNNYGSGTANNAGPYTVFDMAGAAGPVTGGAAPFTNTYIPEGDLGSVNNGQNANGNWQLCVTDDAGGDVGFINAWAVTFSASPAPPPTPCVVDQVIGSIPFNQTGLNTSGFGDDFDSGDACGSSYMNGDDFVFTYTPGANECIDLALTNTGSWVGVFITDGCPDAGANCVASNTNSGGNPSVSGVSLTAGTTYYITVSTFPAPQSTPFDISITACPPPPANDDCSGAYAVTVNPDFSCSSTTAGTVASSTASSQSQASCGGTEDDDVWFSFVATGTSHTIDILNITGSTTDMYHSVWSGTCPTLTLVAGTCSDPNSQTLTGLTPGNTYYIRVYTWTATTGQTSSFDVCVGTPPPPPANDDCGGAYSATVNANGSCATITAGTIASATASSQSQASCGGTEDDDVWFSFVAPAAGNVDIDLLNVSGSTTDLYHSVWSGTCPTLTLVAGTCSDPNSSSVTGLTPGSTYYVRVYSWTSTTGQTTSFDLCLSEPPPTGPCGNPMNNDWCSDPATLTSGAGSWTSNTSPTYSADETQLDFGIFCGSIENNSWYAFVASSTTESFPFASVSNCTSGWGVQAIVMDVTTDINGCCTGFTSMSNCYNPGTTASGTVTATGLTIGNTYYLMVDGNSGDACDFSVTGWTATGILPVTLTEFSGYPYQSHNKLVWTTKAEINNDYFIVQQSKDASQFENIGIIEGNGTSNNVNNYAFIDETPFQTTYYRLKQIDFNGEHEYSKIIYVNRLNKIGAFLYPNPSKSKLFIDITKNSIEGNHLFISYVNILGKSITKQLDISIEKNTYEAPDFESLKPGVYFIQIRTEDGELVKTDKIIKK